MEQIISVPEKITLVGETTTRSINLESCDSISDIIGYLEALKLFWEIKSYEKICEELQTCKDAR